MKLLGGLLVTKIYLAAMSRADVSDRVLKTLPNFYLHVDEFQNFANASFADILSEARKYKLNLTIAHQYVEQMDEFVRPAIFGNVGTMIVFRVGATDAEFLEKEFAPQFEIEDLVNLGFAQIYLKLMIDGLTSSPFSATTLMPIPHPDVSLVKEIIDSSRTQFSHPRAQVEEAIVKFHEGMPKQPVVSKTIPKAVSALPSTSPAPASVSARAPIPTITTVPVSALKIPMLPTKPVTPAKSSVAPASIVVPAKPSYSITNNASKPLQSKQDPKIQTQKNVNALKSALASVLAKAEAEKVSQKSVPISKFDTIKTQTVQPITISTQEPVTIPKHISSMTQPTVLPISPQKSTPTQTSALQNDSSKEVPEEVLNKVLKM